MTSARRDTQPPFGASVSSGAQSVFHALKHQLGQAASCQAEEPKSGRSCGSPAEPSARPGVRGPGSLLREGGSAGPCSRFPHRVSLPDAFSRAGPGPGPGWG